jgi:hypothetical protein
MKIRTALRMASLCALAAMAACAAEDDGGAQTENAAATAPTHHGQLLLVQLEVLRDGFPDQGFFAETTFLAKSDILPPVFEEVPGSPFGCKVFQKGPDFYFPGSEEIEDTHVAKGLNEGSVTLSFPSSDVEIPRCDFVAGVGYRCKGASGQRGDIKVVDAAAGLFSIRDPHIHFVEDDVGRFVNLTGASKPANNGTFFIESRPDSHTIVYSNFKQDPATCASAPSACQELRTSAKYSTLGGLPAGATGRIADTGQVKVKHRAGGARHTQDFDLTFDPGDSFTMTDASRALMNATPVDGSPFSLGCDGAGGSCGAAAASLVVILTTDAPVPPGPPVLMPIPVEKAVQITCIVPGSGTVNVPAAATAFLADSSATRVRTTFARVNPTNFAQPDTDYLFVVGNAQVGITEIE